MERLREGLRGMIGRLWHWIKCGSDDVYMSRSWRQDYTRVMRHEEYTLGQMQQGRVTKTVADLRSEEFWKARGIL